MIEKLNEQEKEQLIEALGQIRLNLEQWIKKRESQLFKNRTLPMSLSDALSELTKDDLVQIRQTLELHGVSTLKKQELIHLLVETIPVKLPKILSLFDHERYRRLQDAYHNGGHIFIPDVELHQILYFMHYGVLFPVLIDGKRALVMPNELMAMLHDLDTVELQNQIKRNTEWIRLVKGMLHFYGILPTKKMVELLNKYTGYKPEGFELSKVLHEATNYHMWFKWTIYGWADSKITDPESVIKEQESRADIDYYPFTRHKLLQASEKDSLDKTQGYHQLNRYLKTHFEITEQEIEKFARTCANQVLIGGKTTDLIEMIQKEFEILSMDELNEFMQKVTAFTNDLRQWILKGYSPNELFEKDKNNLKPLPNVPFASGRKVEMIDMKVKQKVGRNDPCPCGSGLKFKKCCGK
ncbi:MAG: SEC-C domain-containing protein [Bacillales bacterium]|nr:SEC-C domain-containing protein [Bacillales bacterium]